MLTGSFHHQAEERICRKKYIYDFNNFVEFVDSAGKVSVMEAEDFLDFKNQKSNENNTNYLRFAEILEVQSCKRETKIIWRTSFEESE